MNRLYILIRSILYRNGEKRANFYRKNGIYGKIGEKVMIQSYHIPYNPECVFIGSNVRMASNVTLITHDVVHKMLNNIPKWGGDFEEKIGSINIGDNVFIGANTTIMYDVSIGNNVIIGAGSIVTKNIPDNSVCVGCPCKRIGSFDDFVKKRMKNGEK